MFLKSLKNINHLIIAVILIWVSILFFVYPTTNPDGPWALSHTFSILNGNFFKSSFAHDYMEFYNLPYLYGWYNTLMYLPFKGTSLLLYSIFFWNLIWILIYLFYSNKILKKTADGWLKFCLFSIAFLLSTFTYYGRPEIEILPLLLVLLYLLDKFKSAQKNFLFIPLLIALIGMMHPVAGFYAGFFTACYTYDNKLGFSFLLKTAFATIFFVAVLYAPVIFQDYDLWKTNFFERAFVNDQRTFSIYYPLVHFFTYASPLLVYILLLIAAGSRKKRVAEFLYWMVCFAALLIFARGYYYEYLFHFALWRSLSAGTFTFTKIYKLLFFIAVFFGLVFNVGITSFQFLENKNYTSQFKRDLSYMRKFAQDNPSKNVWVSEDCSMSVIDYPNGRLHDHQYENLSGIKPLIDSTQIFFIEKKYMFSYYLSSYKVNKNDSIIIKEIYKPVKGLLRLQFPLKRSDSLGLWIVTAVPKK